jgi:hypothetical protein
LIIRLPREYSGLIGSEADKYQTVHHEKLAFLFVADKEVDNCWATSQNINVDNRLLELEAKIDTILASNKQIPLKITLYQK